MANYTSTLRHIDNLTGGSSAGSGISVEGACDFFNEITKAFTSVGMQRVSDADYADQAGTFVSTTANAGETELILNSSTDATTYGKNLFKHPTKQLYILVQYALSTSGASTQLRNAYVLYTVSDMLSDGVLINTSRFSAGGLSGGTLSWGSNTNRKKFVSYLDDDVFYIVSESVRDTIKSGSTSYNNPNGITLIGLACFLKNSSVTVITIPRTTTTGGSISIGNPSSTNIPTINVSTLYNNVWSTPLRQPFGGLDDPSTPSTSQGVIIKQAKRVLNGEFVYYDFGIINQGVVSDLTPIRCNISGVGKTYIPVFAMGSASFPRYGDGNNNEYDGLLFPWDD